MRLLERPPEIEAIPYFYRSSGAAIVEYFADTGRFGLFSGDLYFQSPTGGVERVQISRWIVRAGDVVEVLDEAEMFARYLPADADEAKATLGGRAWPGSSTNSDRSVSNSWGL